VNGRLLYLDASAITKLVLREAESEALHARVSGAHLVSSQLAQAEVTRAVRRSGAMGRLAPRLRLVLQRLSSIELDDANLHWAGQADPPQLRTLDAIHLAAALLLMDQLDAFVTYDDLQASAAAAVGLPVKSPGR